MHIGEGNFQHVSKANRSRNFRGYYLYVPHQVEGAFNIDTKIPCIHDSIKLCALNFHTKIMVLVLQGLALSLYGN